ncbi:hypothetical protein AB833_15955 [Chromatiales bacterium (ex Bugula neritina AB1)]|nr:hypothetical protein AB833_15955 [Chromatiales bacterium (ex Bugula neritina AB1)]
MFGLANTSANRIYTLEIPGRTGVIGMSACPGIRIEAGRRGNLQKNLKRDILAYQEWGASGVVTLNETEELAALGLEDLSHQLIASGFWWRNLPIVDMNVPAADFEQIWQVEGRQICASLAAGEKIILHCLAGLGRTGMMAARLLVDMGMAPERAIHEVRRVRPRAIQTTPQEEYVHQFGNKTKNDRWSRLQGRQSGPGSAVKSVSSPVGGANMKGFGT